jgi:hypothetical protein
MNKPNFFLTVAAALSVVAISSITALAQLAPGNDQIPGDGYLSSASISASKGTYTNFVKQTGPGITPTVTSTASGTVAVLRVAGSSLISTVTTTATSTVKKSDFVKGKVSNKELLSLIIGTNKPSNYDLVIVAPDGGLVDEQNGTMFVGARLKGRANSNNVILVNNDTIPDGYAYLDVLTDKTTNRSLTNGFTVKGFGGAGLEVKVPASTNGTKVLPPLDLSYAGGMTFSEVIQQDPVTTKITNSRSSSFRTVPASPAQGISPTP